MSVAQSARTVATLTERGELERMRIALENAGDVVFDWTFADDKLVWSGNLPKILGQATAQRMKSGQDYLNLIDADSRQAREKELRVAMMDTQTYVTEYQFEIGANEMCWLEERGTCFRDDQGDLVRIVGLIRDITARRTKEARLTFLATYDELTGHLNRARLCASLNETLTQAHRHNQPGGYMVVGIDGLALFNESHGYDMADELILLAGQRISHTLRSNDLMGRIAGNKFGVVLPNACRADMELVANRLLESVRGEEFETPAGKTIATVSIGCVELDCGVGSSQEAMGRAEEALDKSKRGGRDCYTVHHASPEKVSWRKQNRAVADSIISALSEDRLKMAYQPIVNAETGKPELYESLIRMERRDGSIAAAGEFIPVAEQLGLIRRIDERVLEMVIEEARRSPGVDFSFNVSGLTADDTAWLKKFLDVIEANKDVAPQLIVELTETLALHEIEESARFVLDLRALGCRVAIDDFGAGYTSFRNLQALDVDIVKIDGSFVRNMAESRDNQMFVKTLVDLAKNFGMKVIAEWVENEEEVEILRGFGVDLLQGWYYAPARMGQPWKSADGLGE